MENKLFAFLAMALLVGPMTAHATPVSYTEIVSGQLDGRPFKTFQFDEGLNTISGSAIIDTSTVAGYSNETFGFVVPIGMELRSISYGYNFTNASGNLIWVDIGVDLAWNSDELGVGYAQWFRAQPIYRSDGSVPASTVNPPLYTYESLFTPDPILALPLQAGERSFSAAPNWSYYSANVATATWDYTLTFEVVALQVPEPATLALLGLGLAGVGFGRRKSVLNSLPDSKK